MQQQQDKTGQNMTGQNAGLWQIDIFTPHQPVALEAGLEARFEVTSLSVSRTEGGMLHLQGWCELQPDAKALGEMIIATDSDAEWQLHYLEPRDWIAENRKSFPPVSIGSFWVHGAHIDSAVPIGKIPLQIDAAQAFGSGTHPTTQGCLHLLQSLKKRRHKPRRLLDLGCGSAILAMAAQKQFPSLQVVAADSDILSVNASIENAALNQCAPRGFRVVQSLGFSHPLTRQSAPYDIIFANILAPPLRRLAPQLSRALSHRGRLILSGLLVEQAHEIMARYHAFGMVLCEQVIIGDWIALSLEKQKRG